MQLHVVGFSFKPDVTPAEQASFLDGLRQLLASYSYIKVLALGENTSSRDSSLQYAFIAEFPSHEAVEDYVFDPRHRRWATDSWYPTIDEFKVVSLPG